MTTTGRKDDTGKHRYDLIPPGPLDELARAYTIGAAKYGDRNWEHGIAFSRLFAALQRHAWAFWSGEDESADDGQHHLAAVAWCAFSMLELAVTHPELRRPAARRDRHRRAGRRDHPPRRRMTRPHTSPRHQARDHHHTGANQ